MSVIAWILIIVGSVFSILNWGTLVVTHRRGRFVSAVPLVGALPLGCGLAYFPYTRPFAALAVVADYGTLILIIHLPSLGYQVWSTSQINLVHCFTSYLPDRVIRLKPYRHQIAVILVQSCAPASGENNRPGVWAVSLAGRWAVEKAGFLVDGYGPDRQVLISGRKRRAHDV
jgi:hypothetical protein